MNLISIDTETGGFEHQVWTHALLSIAAVPSWCDEPFYVKVQPDGIIDPGAAAKNGYTVEGWSGALPVKMALLELQRWLWEIRAKEKEADLLAHNAGFDRIWLRHRQQREGIDLELSHRWRCSQAAMGLLVDAELIQAESTSLDCLGEISGFWKKEKRAAANDALQDARCCLHGYQFLISMLGQTHFHPSETAQAPAK